MSADLCSKMFSPRVRVVGCFLDSPEEAVGWMESLCRAFPTNPKEAEAALTELRRSEHAVEVSKIILGGWRRGALRAERGDLFHRYMLARSGIVPVSDTQRSSVCRSEPGNTWLFIGSCWGEHHSAKAVLVV